MHKIIQANIDRLKKTETEPTKRAMIIRVLADRRGVPSNTSDSNLGALGRRT